MMIFADMNPLNKKNKAILPDSFLRVNYHCTDFKTPIIDQAPSLYPAPPSAPYKSSPISNQKSNSP